MVKIVLFFFFAGLLSLGFPYIRESWRDGDRLVPILICIFVPLCLFCGTILLIGKILGYI